MISSSDKLELRFSFADLHSPSSRSLSTSLSQSVSVSALQRLETTFFPAEPSNRCSLLGVKSDFPALRLGEFVELGSDVEHLVQSLSRTRVPLTVVTLLLLHFPQYDLLHFLQACFKHVTEKPELHPLHILSSPSSAKQTFFGVIGLWQKHT